VVLDFEMPGLNGLEVQEQLSRSADLLPVVFMTGHGDIPMSVRAMKAGAVDFLAKPVPGHVLITAIDQAIARGEEERAVRAHRRETKALYDRLTAREREVFAHLISGQLNKEVAFDLGTAERTVKAHRHSILGKLGAQSIADLCRIATELQIAPVRGSA
jgi:FixJ family two-component response regulator